MAGLVANADYAPPICACPTCGTECKRHSVYARKIRDIGLDGPIVLEVRVGNYRCLECQRFFKPEIPGAPKGKRYTTRAVRKATVAVQEDKTTYTALPNRLDRDFSIQPSKSTTWEWFQVFAGSIDIEDYLRWACGRFSGQISVDSIKDKDVHMWFATDPLNKDLILGYHRAEHADGESLTAFLTKLRDEYGIQPQLFTSDDAAVFLKPPRQIWPDVRMQLCHFHVIRTLNYFYLRKSLLRRVAIYKPGKPKKPKRPLTEQEEMKFWLRKKRYPKALKRWTKVFRKRRLLMKSLRSLAKPDSVEHKEAEFIEKICRRYPALATFRAFMLDFYALMDSKDTAAAEILRQTFLTRWADEAREDSHIAYVLKRIGNDDWYAKLFPFAAFENASRTTNSTERANRWFRKRQKTHYRNRKEHTIRNMLHADLVYRRQRTSDGESPTTLKPKSLEIRRTG